MTARRILFVVLAVASLTIGMYAQGGGGAGTGGAQGRWWSSRRRRASGSHAGELD